MTNNNFTELETDRLLLTRLKTSDWKMISFLRSDQEVNKFVKRSSAATQEEALTFIQKINHSIDHQHSYYWKIAERNNDQMIGSICLWNFSEDEKSAEIGYDLSPDYQGKGIMNESLSRIIEFGLELLH